MGTDRAGRGEPHPGLRVLLERGCVAGPLVMVGHSFGGLYVLNYARLFPNQVAGMVLLDSTPPSAMSCALPD